MSMFVVEEQLANVHVISLRSVTGNCRSGRKDFQYLINSKVAIYDWGIMPVTHSTEVRKKSSGQFISVTSVVCKDLKKPRENRDRKASRKLT